MTTTKLKTALVVIDIQEGVAAPEGSGLRRSTPDFETNVERVLAHFREQSPEEAPIIHVAHHSIDEDGDLHPSKPDRTAFRACTGYEENKHRPESMVTKTTSSAFVNTPLLDMLEKSKVERLVFIGTVTEHCVSSTVRSACDMQAVQNTYGSNKPLQNRIIVVGDATALWGPGGPSDVALRQQHALDSLEEFCNVLSTDETLSFLESEWNSS